MLDVHGLVFQDITMINYMLLSKVGKVNLYFKWTEV